MNLSTANVRVAPPDPVGRTRHVLTPLPEPGHFLFVIDNSAAERFVCPTLAKHYLVDGREPHPTNAALIFGGALHVGIEALLHGEPLASAQDRVTDFFVRHPAPLDEYRTLTHALQVLQHYQTRCGFADYRIEILSDDKGPLIERAFELPLGVLEVGSEILLHNVPTFVSHIHVAWAGRIDVVALANGKARIIDHKTTSQAGGKLRQNFIDDFHLSSQTRGYVWAARQLWPEHNIQSFCLDAIQFKKPAAGMSVADRGPRGGEPALDFFRHYFDYEEAAITDWAENALVRVEDFIHSMVRGFYPRETTYCFNRKYGKCSYWDVCTVGVTNPAAAHNLLHSNAYRQVTWNPVADR